MGRERRYPAKGILIAVVTLTFVAAVSGLAWKAWPRLAPPAALTIAVGPNERALDTLSPGEAVHAIGAPGTRVELLLQIVSSEAGPLTIVKTAPLLRSDKPIHVLGESAVAFRRGALGGESVLVELGRVEARAPTIVHMAIAIPAFIEKGIFDAEFMPTVSTSGTTSLEQLRIPLEIEVRRP